jgi:DNA helicase-2/ATP-dependent DNA helicase PcrA
MDNLLDKLNESQREAVVYNDGPQLIIAGAGSGKTRVLTYKIAYLLQHEGVSPWNVLALTFTNKAANEMKERIGNLIGAQQAMYLNMGTFHSMFSRILRREAPLIGYRSNFTIYDEADSRSLIKTIVKEMNLDDKVYKPASVHALISMAKNHLISAEQYEQSNSDEGGNTSCKHDDIVRIYKSYNQRCLMSNAMDFDDLLVNTYQLFQQHQEVCNKYSQRYQYVLVDEYQDTNRVQQAILYQLAVNNRHVCVVGDDAQSIYGFRGANIDNILDFQQIYADSKLFKLERNYRSTQHIVQAANSLIKHNERQIPKGIYSENAVGEKLLFKPAYSDKEEALIVCKDIKRLRKSDHCDYTDFAILYRTNSQSRSFEEEMRKQNIPYKIFGGMSFYQRKEIKDVIAYFRLTVNPDDEEAIKRIINYPARGIGGTTIQKIADASASHGVSMWQVISHAGQYLPGVNRGTLTKMATFCSLISSFIAERDSTDVYALGKRIIEESGIYRDIFTGSDSEALSKQENLQEFMASVQAFSEDQKETSGEDARITDFLQEISLQTDLESEGDESQSRVSLMTVHAAKGLEFPTVFVVGLEENIFPSSMSSGTARGLEEERRLLYVAITRAEKHCILTCAKNRFRYGRMEMDVPSRFINEIDPSLIETESASSQESESYFGMSGGRLRGGRTPFDDEFSIDKPYHGTTAFDNEYRRGANPRMQNNRPVATQFMADSQYKATTPHRREQAVDPFTPAFKQRLAASGGNLRKISDAMTNGGRALGGSTPVAPATPSAGAKGALYEGCVIEHQRFGIGTVVKIEGAGENMKATVDFKNVGQKQLLLKFARYTILP